MDSATEAGLDSRARTHQRLKLKLNERGLVTGTGQPAFHSLTFRNNVTSSRKYQLRTREQRLRDAGTLTLTEIAQDLDVSTATAHSSAHPQGPTPASRLT
jgi:hypothetical protein